MSSVTLNSSARRTRSHQFVPRYSLNSPTGWSLISTHRTFFGALKRSFPGGAAARHVERLDGQLLLQGGQNGRGWTLLIAEDGGDMTATVVGDEVAFVIHGACLVP